MIKETYFNKAAAQHFGFNLDESEIRELANISLSLVTGAIHYTEAELAIQKFCGTRFEYREGNKRIVLLSKHEGYVVKIAKMAGFEGLRDNLNEQETCIFMNEKSKYAKMGYAPMAIATYSTQGYQGLLFVQEQHTEILEVIAEQIPGAVSDKALLKKYVEAIAIEGYNALATMYTSLAEELFLSDAAIISAAANLSLNNKNPKTMSMCDLGSVLPKSGYEACCPKCGAVMVYEVEPLSAFTSANNIMDLNMISPVYRCLGDDTHTIDPNDFFSRLISGDESVIMTAKEANIWLQKNSQKIAAAEEEISNMHVEYRGKTYYLGSEDIVDSGVTYRRLYLNNRATNLYVSEDGDVVEVN